MKSGNLLETMAAKIDQNLSTYLPKVQNIVYEFEDFKLQADDDFATIKL